MFDFKIHAKKEEMQKKAENAFQFEKSCKKEQNAFSILKFIQKKAERKKKESTFSSAVYKSSRIAGGNLGQILNFTEV